MLVSAIIGFSVICLYKASKANCLGWDTVTMTRPTSFT